MFTHTLFFISILSHAYKKSVYSPTTNCRSGGNNRGGVIAACRWKNIGKKSKFSQNLHEIKEIKTLFPKIVVGNTVVNFQKKRVLLIFSLSPPIFWHWMEVIQVVRTSSSSRLSILYVCLYLKSIKCQNVKNWAYKIKLGNEWINERHFAFSHIPGGFFPKSFLKCSNERCTLPLRRLSICCDQ